MRSFFGIQSSHGERKAYTRLIDNGTCIYIRALLWSQISAMLTQKLTDPKTWTLVALAMTRTVQTALGC